MILADAKLDEEDFIVCLGLGSNVGDKESNLLKALDFIKNGAKVFSGISPKHKSPLSECKDFRRFVHISNLSGRKRKSAFLFKLRCYS
jgi:hypothetical protein